MSLAFLAIVVYYIWWMIKDRKKETVDLGEFALL
ncbi:MAG: FeoB-associated Cys-rich membrane protein [Candidatus Omnitrophica bacterium]|nr:FeoB-associated Cys-rich membrane protein [Candidatus Omnitrophota bacterium]